MAKKSKPSPRSKSFEIEAFGKTIKFEKTLEYRLPYHATVGFKGTCEGVSFFLVALTRESVATRWRGSYSQQRKVPAWAAYLMNDSNTYNSYLTSGEQPTPEKAIEKVREEAIERFDSFIENTSKAREETIRKLVQIENELTESRTKKVKLEGMKASKTVKKLPR